MDIRPEAKNTQDAIHKTHESHEEGKDQTVDTVILLRRGNKIPMEGFTEIKSGAETEGKTSQTLPYQGSVPFTTTKPRLYCGCQQEFFDRIGVC